MQLQIFLHDVLVSVEKKSYFPIICIDLSKKKTVLLFFYSKSKFKFISQASTATTSFSRVEGFDRFPKALRLLGSCY